MLDEMAEVNVSIEDRKSIDREEVERERGNGHVKVGAVTQASNAEE